MGPLSYATMKRLAKAFSAREANPPTIRLCAKCKQAICPCPDHDWSGTPTK